MLKMLINAHKCSKLFIINYWKNFTYVNILDLYLVIIKFEIKTILIKLKLDNSHIS